MIDDWFKRFSDMNRGGLALTAVVISQSLIPYAWAEKATTAVSVEFYDCQQGMLAVTHARKVSGEEYVIVEFEDKIIRMPRLTDRSDPVFASMHGDAGSYRWRILDENGALSWLGPEAGAMEKVLFDGCRFSPRPEQPKP